MCGARANNDVVLARTAEGGGASANTSTHLLQRRHVTEVHALRHICCCRCCLLLPTAAPCCCFLPPLLSRQQAAPQVLVHDLTDEGCEGGHDLGQTQEDMEEGGEGRSTVFTALTALQSSGKRETERVRMRESGKARVSASVGSSWKRVNERGKEAAGCQERERGRQVRGVSTRCDVFVNPFITACAWTDQPHRLRPVESMQNLLQKG